MKKKLVCILICLCLVLITAVNVNAQLPGIINFQAKIADNNGIPLNEPHSFNFSIIDQNSNILWDAYNIPITIENGLYSVKLGDVSLGMDPIQSSIFDENDETYLRIFVDGEQLSDQQILPTCYAFKSEKSDDTHKIAGNPVSGTPNTNQVLKWNGSQWEPDEDSGLTLPYSFIYSGGDRAFEIKNTGTQDLAEFEIDNPSNSGNVLYLKTNGTGEPLYINNDGTERAIYISNDASASDGIKIKNNSINGNAIYISNYGDDEALYVKNYGTDNCGEFRIDNASNDNDAIYATTNGTGYAGYFPGDVYISYLSKGGGSFKIDHPLEPENKYLYHSFVESPDMMNVYNGNIILDSNGDAQVELPDWFESLNKDFRYQLTCVGGFAPVYVSEEVSNSMFKIAGGDPGMKISWQVTGIRQDPFANEHRIKVEVEKSSKEKGHYLHYKEYNQPIENSIEAVRHPDILEYDNSENN